jgi:hypothetical protein
MNAAKRPSWPSEPQVFRAALGLCAFMAAVLAGVTLGLFAASLWRGW